MNKIIEEIDKRIAFLEKLQTKIAKHNLKDPGMRIKVVQSKNHYYFCTYPTSKSTSQENTRHKTNATSPESTQSSQPKPTYIRRKDEHKIRNIAQHEYEEKLQKNINAELPYLKQVKANLYTLEQKERNLHPAKSKLIKPLVLSDEEYVKRWESVDYQPGFFGENTPQKYFTDRGERVRSKSELIIANLLNSRGIPYRYEYPITIEERIFRPDFTVLNKRTRQEYIWEHLGMADNAEYIARNIEKYDILTEHGYMLGKNLLISIETSNITLSMSAINSLIDCYLL